MSERKKDYKSDNDLDELKVAYQSLDAKRGKCPGPEDLVHYQQRTLSTEEMLLIKQHVALCGLCDWAIAQLGEFDSVAFPALQQEERLPKRTRSPLLYFLYPALGSAIVLLLFIPVYYFMFQPNVVPVTTNGAASARDFNLGDATATRSASIANKKLVILSRSERFFILNFFVPVRRDHIYEMEILNQKEEKVNSGEIRSRDSLGNFSIVCSSTFFSDGDYSLTVKEAEQQTRQVKDEYRFLFRLERHQ